jgi:hypothetical protein
MNGDIQVVWRPVTKHLEGFKVDSHLARSHDPISPKILQRSHVPTNFGPRHLPFTYFEHKRESEKHLQTSRTNVMNSLSNSSCYSMYLSCMTSSHPSSSPLIVHLLLCGIPIHQASVLSRICIIQSMLWARHWCQSIPSLIIKPR